MLRKLVLAFMLLFAVLPAFATYNAGIHIVLRSDGSDANGMLWDPTVASPGTNESNAAAGTAVSCTIQSTTTQLICTPAISSTTHGPGNGITIASGAGCTIGTFEIKSQAAGTGTMDRSVGTAASVCAGVVGGAALTPGAILTAINANATTSNPINWVDVLSGTYSISTGLTHTLAVPIIWQSFQTDPGDLTPTTYTGHRALITTASNITLYTNSSSRPDMLLYVKLSTTSGTVGEGFLCGTNGSPLLSIYSSFDGFSSAIDLAAHACATSVLVGTEVKNSTGFGILFGANTETLTLMQGNNIHNNAGGGVSNSGAASFNCSQSLITDNTGYGLYSGSNSQSTVSDHCTYANNTTGEVFFAANISPSQFPAVIFTNNVLWGSTSGYCMSLPAASTFTGYGTPEIVSTNNAYGNCASGNTNNWADLNPISLSTTSPFTSSTDYTPNTTAGAGALLRNTAMPGAFAGAASTSYMDIGAVRHQDTGGSTATPTGYVQ
jgi:hypothetical protein